MEKCNWCGGEICEDEVAGSSVGAVHVDCAMEVAMDDRAGGCEEPEPYDDGYGW